MERELAPGTLVAGRFAIERVAGAGGMAKVYRAHDRTSGVAVAVKVLLRDGAEEGESEQRLKHALTGHQTDVGLTKRVSQQFLLLEVRLQRHHLRYRPDAADA